LIVVKKLFCAAALAILCASCNTTTATISETRAEASIRKACPAFRTGSFTTAVGRTYGAEQITTFQNASRFQCRCLAKSESEVPTCNQVRPFSASQLQEG
jgi:hypothetical protein